MARWAIDVGTSNTAVASWDEGARRAALVHLPRVCRPRDPTRPLDGAGLVPSMVEVLPAAAESRGVWAWLTGASRARHAEIGCVAEERNHALPSPAFTPSFKGALAGEPTRTLARLRDRTVSAREVGQLFLRELLRELREVTGERPRELVLTAPVASFDAYRAELRELVRPLGVSRVRFVDEPVAAAMGYGLSLASSRRVLVFDMGGGTLHAALVALTARGAAAGRCEVLAKEGRAVGGNLVDRWLLEDAVRELELVVERDPTDGDVALWQRLMLAEARRVKEAVHTGAEETLIVLPPEELAGVRARLRDRPSAVAVDEARLRRVLEARGLFSLLDEVVGRVAEQGVDEVLLVGGSTLLPGVYPWFEARFGRDRVRAWQPFEAVALGAAAYAGEAFAQADFVVHDYAILTHDAATGAAEHTVVVPSGTRFPTPPDFWRRPLVPTCALGAPETLFKLIICEIGRHAGDGTRFGWDASGTLRPLSAGGVPDVVVRLNAANPTMGTLDPPHKPSDRRPRLDVSFAVDGDRWLVVTVRDLLTQRVLMEREPVVRLL